MADRGTAGVTADCTKRFVNFTHYVTAVIGKNISRSGSIGWRGLNERG